MPVCIDCGRELPTNDFPKNGKDKLGNTRHRPDCKLCYAATRKGSKKKHNKFCSNDKHRTGEVSSYSITDWAASLAHFNGRCMYCGRPMSRRLVLTRDHIVAVSKGGKTTKHNIGPSCRHCNTSKNASDMEEWFRKQKFFNEETLKIIIDWRDKDGR